MACLLVALIRFYQLAISPWLGPSCRFFPSCSEYARQCLEHHGALRGSWYSARRICRCHPWGGSGYDPAPPKERERSPLLSQPSDVPNG